MADTTVKTRGSVKPDLSITISDASSQADFSSLATSDVHIVGEMHGSIVFDSTATSLEVAADNKSAIVRRAWAPEDVGTAGHLWVRVRVDWGAGLPQYFPAAGPLRIDIVHAPGDT